jgi:hypothetical protein
LEEASLESLCVIWLIKQQLCTSKTRVPRKSPKMLSNRKEIALAEAIKADQLWKVKFMLNFSHYLSSKLNHTFTVVLASSICAAILAFFWSRGSLYRSIASLFVIVNLVFLVDERILRLEIFMHLLFPSPEIKVDLILGQTKVKLPQLHTQYFSPLGLAIYHNSFKCYDWLLARTIENQYSGMTAKELTQEIKKKKLALVEVSKDQWSPLFLAAYFERLDIIRHLLSTDFKLVIDEPSRGTPGTAVHCAMWRKHIQVLELLVMEGKANANAQNKEGQTPLLFGAYQGSLELCKFLLEHCEVDPNIPSSKVSLKTIQSQFEWFSRAKRRVFILLSKVDWICGI